MSDHKKTALLADEQDILAFSKKIERNQAEDEQFVSKLQACISRQLPSSEVIRIGTTPNALRIVGAEAIPLVVTQAVLQNSTSTSKEDAKHTDGHGIPFETLKSIPEALRSPIFICKGSLPGTVAVISDLTNAQNQNVLISMVLSVQGQHSQVNRITSIYGKKNIEGYLSRMAAQNGILAMHIKKAEELSSNIGLQLPKSATILCFDDSIAYSTANVKRGMEQSLQPSRAEAEIDPVITALAADLDAFWSDYDIDNYHERFTDGLTFTGSMAADIAAGTASREWIRDTLQGILIASPDVAARSDRELRAAELLNRLQNIDERMTTMSQTPDKHTNDNPTSHYRVDLATQTFLEQLKQAAQRYESSLDQLVESGYAKPTENAPLEGEQYVEGIVAAISSKAEIIGQSLADKGYDTVPIVKVGVDRDESGKPVGINEKTKFSLLDCKIEILHGEDSVILKVDEDVSHGVQVKDVVTQSQNTEIAPDTAEFVQQIKDMIRAEGMEQKSEPAVKKEAQTPKQKQSVEPKYEYVNQDYYRSLHPHQRQVETMPQALADLFMKELKRFEVPFSAVKKPDGTTMVTVDKTTHSLAISKAKDLATDAFLQQTHTVNKDYFFSIPSKQREQIILPAVQAELAMSLLQQQDVPFSALKKEDRTTITVDGTKHAAALAEAVDRSQSWKQAIDGIINKEELSSIIEKGGKHIDLPSTVAIDVMKALKAANIPYGGVERNGNTMLAVAPEHQAALNQIVLESKMINPNHYQQCPSLTHSAVLPTAMAEKLMQSLDEKKIPYHGIRYKESVVVSVHSDHQAQLIDLASLVKKSQQLETINPDYFRSLPKEERFTRRMPEAEARQVVAELQEKGIQHSAVFDGRKSGVTISKADEKREGFFLGRSKRDGVRRDAAAAPKQDTPSKGVDTKNRSNDTHGL